MRKCYFCGKFIGYGEAVYTWTPYGGVLDLEPPEDEHAHARCYDNSSMKDLIIKTSWMKPEVREPAHTSV